YYLGSEYFSGARFWYEKVVKNLAVDELTKTDGLLVLAHLYEKGLGGNKNDTLAFDRYYQAADLKHMQAMFQVGLMYERGQGILMDHQEAMKWLLLAAESGYDHAQFYLGFVYNTGSITKQDQDKALYWIRNAAGQGHPQAIEKLKSVFGEETY
ncbi:MAG: sel1 repeat family protein, partial [Cyclobacteriaceae bacterium]|nr:sel1 repeat family protein [Cyclobacteriaceae bacterium]